MITIASNAPSPISTSTPSEVEEQRGLRIYHTTPIVGLCVVDCVCIGVDVNYNTPQTKASNLEFSKTAYLTKQRRSP